GLLTLSLFVAAFPERLLPRLARREQPGPRSRGGRPVGHEEAQLQPPVSRIPLQGDVEVGLPVRAAANRRGEKPRRDGEKRHLLLGIVVLYDLVAQVFAD